MAIVAQCPSCGVDLTFRVDTTLVRVCDHCSAAVARGDQTLASLGTVADLADSRSPLALYIDGRYGDKPFTIVGRAQIQHGAGGMWDEWYCAFDDGRWGWLAEAQGKFYMTFAVPLADDAPLYDDLEPGRPVAGLGGGAARVVNELGTATMRGAEGELPYRLETGREYPFADLSGDMGEFATIDYSDAPPTLYVGRDVSLADLGFSDRMPAQDVRETRVRAVAIECPNCQGSLDLIAPDRAERVVCGYCDAQCDVNQGNLELLKVLDQDRLRPTIALGTTAEFEGHELTVIGYMVRGVRNAWGHFTWDEYLMYAPALGFRWLMCQDLHWTYVRPITVADVRAVRDDHAEHDGTRFDHFQSSSPEVEYVQGEFYWRVELGEMVDAGDYVAPPFVLSEERTDREVVWSLGEYLPVEQVEAKVGIELVPPASDSVAPNQPFPHKEIYRVWRYVVVAAALLTIALVASRADTQLLHERHTIPASDKTEPHVLFTESVFLRSNQNIEIELHSPVSNSWVYVTGDLVDETTGLVQEFSAAIQYYSGISSGERWTEGDTTTRVYLSALPAGNYTLRLAVEREQYSKDVRLSVRVRQGVVRHRYWIGLVLGICLIPGIVYWRQRSFEAKRWEDSDH